jgi:hypothetical protein
MSDAPFVPFKRATPDEISKWFDDGVEQGAHFMIVVYDSFDYEDYPVYVSPGSDPLKVAKEKYGYDPNDPYAEKNMTRVKEVYDLRLSKETQLAERRAFNFGENNKSLEDGGAI